MITIDKPRVDRKRHITRHTATVPIRQKLDLSIWSHLPEDQQQTLTWFHRHCLDRALSFRQAGAAINYDKSVVHRILKPSGDQKQASYSGDWAAVCSAIVSYRATFEQRSQILNSTFTENQNTNLICGALEYALASQTMVVITGESGMSKTMTLDWWLPQNNHGRARKIEACETQPYRALLVDLLRMSGTQAELHGLRAREVIHKGWNENQLLIIDEAHFLLPEPRQKPKAIEFIRRLHDQRRCAIAFVASTDFATSITRMEYHFQQFLGRARICRLISELTAQDVLPILDQYFEPEVLRNTPLQRGGSSDNAKPTVLTVSNPVIEIAVSIANDRPFLKDYPRLYGRLRKLVELLRLAWKITRKIRPEGRKLSEKDLMLALKLDRDMAGQLAVPTPSNPRRKEGAI